MQRSAPRFAQLLCLFIFMVCPWLANGGEVGTPALDGFLRQSLKWRAPDLGVEVPVRVYFAEAATSEPAPVIVYVMNHGYPRVGQESDESILSDYLRQGYLVMTVDFAGVSEAVSPKFDFDLLALQHAIYGYKTESILAGEELEPLVDYCWFLPAGCRLARDLVYFDLEKHGSFGTKEQVLKVWNGRIHQRFGVPKLDDPEAMTNRDGTPLDYKLYMDIIYPSQPSRPLSVFVYNATQSNRTRGTRNDVTSGPHIFGFSMRGYVTANSDHCWNPLSRHWAWGFLDGVFTLDTWNGLKSNTAAIRFLRTHAESYGINPELICAMGYSKGSYGVIRLADPEHEGQAEHATFEGFPEGSPEPQPWPGVSSRISAAYQAVGGSARRPEYVRSNLVPSLTACGQFDKFKFWPIFPELIETYESRDVNHLAFWMHELAHELPTGFDPWHGRDRYELLTTFFDQYLKPDEHPAPVVLYTFPKAGDARVGLDGASQALPDREMLPKDALKHVALEEPITVHFAPQVTPESVAGGVRVVRAADGAAVAGTWRARRGNTYYQFEPAAELEPGTEYRLVIGTGVRSERGTALAGEEVVEFRTRPAAERAGL